MYRPGVWTDFEDWEKLMSASFNSLGLPLLFKFECFQLT